MRPKHAIAHAAQMAGLALAAVDAVPREIALTPPADLVRLVPTGPMVAVDDVSFRQWILGSAFREAVESLNVLLIDVRDAVAYAELRKQHGLFGDIVAADVTRKEEFAYLGLRRKLNSLRDEYRVPFRSDSVDCLLSIASARNCLVHRFGIVERADANSPTALIVGWRHREVISPSDGISRKMFAIGERVDFSSAEFADIGGFLLDCVDEIVVEVERITR